MTHATFDPQSARRAGPSTARPTLTEPSGSRTTVPDEALADDPMLERLHTQLSNFSIAMGVLALVLLTVNQVFFIGH